MVAWHKLPILLIQFSKIIITFLCRNRKVSNVNHIFLLLKFQQMVL